MTHGYELEQEHRPLEFQVHGDAGSSLPSCLPSSIGRRSLVSMIAIVAASCVLTFSVVMRYFLKMPTDWQDEVSIFLLVGATFLTGAYVQAHRGHVAIEALAEILPAGVNRLRLIVRRYRLVRLLRLLLLEVVDAASRSDRRRADDVVDLGTAAVDTLRPDDGRHDAALPCSSCCRSWCAVLGEENRR